MRKFLSRFIARSLAALIILVVPACAPESLVGSYISTNAEIGVATLDILEGQKFKFCFQKKCSEGDFEITWKGEVNEGRLQFNDPFLEEFYKANAETTHPGLPDYAKVRRGVQETNYWLGPPVIAIDGGSDAMFYRR